MAERTILVVDDKIRTLKGLLAILAAEGYRVLQASGGDEALEVYRKDPAIDVVLSDLKMPGMDGVELFHQMNAQRPAPPFVIMTAYGTVRSAVEALKQGVADYLIKPLDFEELSIVLDKAVRGRRMAVELEQLKGRIGDQDSFHGIIGADPQMQEIYRLVRTVGPTDASVMIYGETGTGKELLARALHLESTRGQARLVSLNCAAVAETLLEAELFGYVKGAFTGAWADKRGMVELAHGGTLFLDEIGHMTTALQSKLLRFVQEMTFEPVGSTESRKVDVRIIAATNLDLAERIDSGRFLGDLLYRLEVISIEVPPLRGRPQDIPLLVDHFVRSFCRKYDKPVKRVEPEAMELLMAHQWPGNVRELQNCLARAVILARGEGLTPRDFAQLTGLAAPDRGEGLLPQLPQGGVSLREMEEALIKETMTRAEGNKSLAARMLGISRKSLYKKLSRIKVR